jgi:hypothetical protein
MDIYKEYRSYISDPTSSKEERLYNLLLEEPSLFIGINIASLSGIPSLRLFELLLNKNRNKSRSYYQSLLEALLAIDDRFWHIEYLLSLFPHLGHSRVLVREGEELESVRQKSLDLLTRVQVCFCYFESKIHIKTALEHGLFPYNTELYLTLLENINIPVRLLRHYEGVDLPNDTLQSFKTGTEAHCGILQQKLNTTVLYRWLYPHRLYSSNRLKTDMSLFRTPGSNIGTMTNQTLEVDGYYYSRLILEEGVSNEARYLPVTRYAKSIKTGLYHDCSEKEYCGTFYYLEPESLTFLVANSFLVSQTKYSSLKFILDNYEIDSRDRFESEAIMAKYLGSNKNKAWESGQFGNTLLVASDGVDNSWFYQGNTLDLYAAEDVFDQQLCRLAQNVGIDIVILTRMVGSHQIVQEVLDTRTREQSFKNLVFSQ